MIVVPVSLVARHHRALDRRGAAPARQQRRVHVQHPGWSSSSGSLISWPNAQTTTASGAATARARRRTPRSLTLGRLVQLATPSSRAASAAGGGRQLAPRPWRLSGGATTSAGACSLAARRPEHGRRELRGAEVGGPQWGLVGSGGRALGRGSLRLELLVLRALRGEGPALAQRPQRAARAARAGRARASAPRRGGRPRAGSPAPPGPTPRSVSARRRSVGRWRGRGAGARRRRTTPGQAEAALLGGARGPRPSSTRSRG